MEKYMFVIREHALGKYLEVKINAPSYEEAVKFAKKKFYKTSTLLLIKKYVDGEWVVYEA